MKPGDVAGWQADPIEQLYATFAGPVPREIEGCPCCLDTRNGDLLLTTPLRAIDGMKIWRYVSGVFLTVGGVTDFPYLLPRILDIALNDPSESNSIEIVLGKLRLAGWDAWPKSERAAIIAVIDALFDAAVASGTADPDDPWLMSSEAAAVLCGAARADLDPRRWLDKLLVPAAAPVLRDLRENFGPAPGPFWDGGLKGHAIVVRWLAEEAPASP